MKLVPDQVADAPTRTEFEQWMQTYNERYVYCKELDRVFDLLESRDYKSSSFFTGSGNDKYYDSESKSHKSVPRAWMQWEGRRTVTGVGFRPGDIRIVLDHHDQDICHINLWDGLSIEPAHDYKPHDVETYYLSTVREVLADNQPFNAGVDLTEHFLDLIASLLTYPESRLSMYLVLTGEQGTGKNYVLEPLVKAMGQHCVPFTVTNYLNKFNFSKAKCRVALINEMGSELASTTIAEMDAELKLDADASTVERWVEPKHGDRRQTDRCCFVIIISNYVPPLAIDYGDRRALVLRSSDKMAMAGAGLAEASKDESYWSARWAWMNDGGVAQVLAWAEHRVAEMKRDGRELPAQAVTTQAKRQWAEDRAGSGPDGWCKYVKQAPQEALIYKGVELAGCRFLSNAQLLRLYNSRDPDAKQLDATTLGQRMRKNNFVGGNGSRSCGRYWCVRGETAGWIEDRDIIEASIKKAEQLMQQAEDMVKNGVHVMRREGK